MAVITIASVVAVSRSAIIGLATAVIFSLPAVPIVFRWFIAVGGGILSLIVFAVVPGMASTIVALFAGASNDPSTQSRVDGLARVPEFMSSSPVIGQGFGTFLPRYYIFDNAWALILVELGILGAVCFALLVIVAIGGAYWASWTSPLGSSRAMSKAIAASMITVTVLMFFFDGFSFTISAGVFFLLAGLTAAMRAIAVADAGDRLERDTGAKAVGGPRGVDSPGASHE